jgi:hypothetical protein
MALETIQPLTEMSTRNLPGGKGRPARQAEDLVSVSRLSRCGSLDVSQHYGPPWPVTGIALPLHTEGSVIGQSCSHCYVLPLYLLQIRDHSGSLVTVTKQNKTIRHDCHVVFSLVFKSELP